VSSRDRLSNIKAKLSKIEELIREIRNDLDDLGKEPTRSEIRKQPKQLPPDEGELRDAMEKLYQEFISGDHHQVQSFLSAQSKSYLAAFCKANSLSIDTTRQSKDQVVEQVMQWLAQRRAISKPIK
jgi:DNA repair exonuclease SbcCD ATPase subunit